MVATIGTGVPAFAQDNANSAPGLEERVVSATAETTLPDVATGAVAEAKQIGSEHITVAPDPTAPNRTRISFDLTNVDVKEGDYFTVTYKLDDSVQKGQQVLGTFNEIFPNATSDWSSAKGSTQISSNIVGVTDITARTNVVDQDGNTIFNIEETKANGEVTLKFIATDAFSRAENPVVGVNGYTSVILSKVLDMSPSGNITNQLGDISALPDETKSSTVSKPAVLVVNGETEYPGTDVTRSILYTKVAPVEPSTPNRYDPGMVTSIQKNGPDTFMSTFVISTATAKEGDGGTKQRVTVKVDPSFTETRHAKPRP